MAVIEGNMQCNNLEMTLFYTTVSEHNVSVRCSYGRRMCETGLSLRDLKSVLPIKYQSRAHAQIMIAASQRIIKLSEKSEYEMI